MDEDTFQLLFFKWRKTFVHIVFDSYPTLFRREWSSLECGLLTKDSIGIMNIVHDSTYVCCIINVGCETIIWRKWLSFGWFWWYILCIFSVSNALSSFLEGWKVSSQMLWSKNFCARLVNICTTDYIMMVKWLRYRSVFADCAISRFAILLIKSSRTNPQRIKFLDWIFFNCSKTLYHNFNPCFGLSLAEFSTFFK